MKGTLLPAGSLGLAGVLGCRRSPDLPGPVIRHGPKTPSLSSRVRIPDHQPWVSRVTRPRVSGWPFRGGALLPLAETHVSPGPGVWSRGNVPFSCAGQGAGVGSGQGVPTGPGAGRPLGQRRSRCRSRPGPRGPPGRDRRGATSALATEATASRRIASYEAPDETHRAADAVHRLIASSEGRGFGASAEQRLAA